MHQNETGTGFISIPDDCKVADMPSLSRRKPEVVSREDELNGFLVNIYDGEFLIQVHPHENGYQLNLASKSGLGDRAFLRTFERNEDIKNLIERQYEAIDSEAVFETIDEHFEDDIEYRVINVKSGIKGVGGQGANIYVETGETVPTLVDERDYRNDRWKADAKYRFTVWPNEDYIEVHDSSSGERIADYWPNSYLDYIRNEEKDDHERERGPTSVPGVHRPISGGDAVDDGPVVHTRHDCAHFEQLEEVEYVPADVDPASLPAGEVGELPLRWCLSCRYKFPTPEELRERYEKK